MTTKLQIEQFPLFGKGEQSAAGPGAFMPGELQRMRNATIGGPGVILQQPDWLLADTAMNLEGTPTEVHAICGIYPFQVKGGASSPSAGVIFSFDTTTDIIYLHQVDENQQILRSFVAYTGYNETDPPFITGFEMFNKFYFCDYSFNLATQRKGMAVFDPDGSGTINLPTYDLNSGAAALRFRGISKHRGGTILGWSYDDDVTPDGPSILRWSKYTIPDTWVTDTSETSAGRVPVGTIGVGIVGCAMSGQYTIIGKQNEIFALDGDFGSQFYVRQIGESHGPVSTVGIVSMGPAAVWMSAQGPTISEQGKAPKILTTDKATRRLLNYLDLNSSWAVHDSSRQRVVWAVRRNLDDDGNQLTSQHKTELLHWDYARNVFYVSNIPKQIFSLGVVSGPGIDLAAPSGVVSSIAAANVTSNGALITWTAGDTAPDVTFIVEYRKNGTSTWFELGRPANASLQVSSLQSATTWDVRIAQVRNSQTSAFVESISLFTTGASGTVVTPTNVAVTEYRVFWDQAKNIAYGWAEVTWDPYFSDRSVRMVIYRASSGGPFAGATEIGRALTVVGAFADPTSVPAGESRTYWVQMENLFGTTSTAVAATPNPLFFSAAI